jgi:cytoskeletal protein RodZ
MTTALRRDPITQLGEFLRTARERAGLTLQQVADTTKIPQRHLDAIEHGDMTVVPKGPYRRGEVRAFAQAVGLDQKVALAQLDEALPQAPQEAPVPVPVEPVEPRSSWGVTVVLLMAVVGLTTLLLWNRDAATPVPGAPPAAAPAPLSAATTPTSAHEAAPQAPVSPQPPAAVAVPAAVTVPAAVAVPHADASSAATISPVLIVTSQPPGARVVVDGIGRGTTPARIEYLSPGEKTVRVLHDGYGSEERSVSLTPKQPTVTLHVELRPN